MFIVITMMKYFLEILKYLAGSVHGIKTDFNSTLSKLILGGGGGGAGL